MNIRHKLSINKEQIQTNRAKAIIIFIFTWKPEQTHTSTHGSDAILAANGKDAAVF
jgi:hypothetical protein